MCVQILINAVFIALFLIFALNWTDDPNTCYISEYTTDEGTTREIATPYMTVNQ